MEKCDCGCGAEKDNHTVEEAQNCERCWETYAQEIVVRGTKVVCVFSHWHPGLVGDIMMRINEINDEVE
jgi:hypothetical protein